MSADVISRVERGNQTDEPAALFNNLSSLAASEAGPSRLPIEDAPPRRRSKCIQAGDLVILFTRPDEPSVPLTVTPDQEYSSRYGAFPHNTMIGKPFGAKLQARNNKGFLYLLRPTPSLWTLSLPHRTQILYLPDIAFIISRLGITPGARVIESGTGSGSMTHALAKAVSSGNQVDVRWRGVPGMGAAGGGGRRGQRSGRTGEQQSTPDTREASAEIAAEDGDAGAKTPTESLSADELGGPLVENEGRVWSYEFHSERARKAREELEAHGLSPRAVAINHRNVCKSGFGLPEEMKADAVFLDLPAPWEAIPYARQSMRRDVATRLCAFSPCIEQVLRTVQTLHDNGFSDVETVESLTREYEMPSGEFGPPRDIGSAIQKIQDVEKTKELKRQEQIKRSRERNAQKYGGDATTATEGDEGEDVGAKRNAEDLEQDTRSVKRAKTETGEATVGDDGAAADTADTADAGGSGASAFISGGRDLVRRRKLQPANVYGRPIAEMRGHTSYLTFATLRPQSLTLPNKSNGSAL